MLVRRVMILVGVGSFALVTGCSSKPEQQAGHTPPQSEILSEVAAMYKGYVNDHRVPPKSMEDLEHPYEASNPHGGGALRRGDVVMFWGGSLPSGNESSVVLAYEKKVPEEGGLVLMQDGTVKEMTADQFRAAPKAGQ